MADLTVDAELRLRTAASLQGLRGLASQLSGLSSSLQGAQRGSESLFGSMVRFGALQTGVGMLANGFRSLVGFATRFQGNLESTRIGLSAVMSAVEGLSFERAGVQAGEVFDQLRDDALRSTATTSELFGIYQSIYGPIRNAGVGMEVVREITNNTVAAAGALGVDLAQASRDISAMARGSAGLDVRLFSMLRSTGAIAEDAQAFNRLTAGERVARLQSALGRFTVAADAYGQSFAGVTSTFQDIVQSFTGAAFGPVFERVRRYLSEINGFLLEHRSEIVTQLGYMGERVGRAMDRIADRIRAMFTAINGNWDQIVYRINATVNRLAQLLPGLVRAAKLYAAIQVGRQALGTAATIGARGVQGADFLSRLFGSTSGTVAATGVGVAGVGAAGAASAGAGAGAGAAAAGVAGAEAAVGASALTSALGTLTAIAAPLAAVLVSVAGAAYFVYSYWESLVDILGWLEPILNGIYNDFAAVAANLWTFLRPILQLIGGALLGPVIAGLIALSAVLRVVSLFVRALSELFAMIGRVLQPLVDYVFDEVLTFFERLARLAGMMETGQGAEARRRPVGLEDVSDPLAELQTAFDESMRAQERDWRRPSATGAAAGAPAGRTSVHNDFRGSRITVNQEFREADPDRVAITMIEDLARFADQRIQSGFVPALTR